MSVKIRLKRTGTKKKISWRIVVADSRSPRDGRCIEEVGTYDCRKNPAKVELKADRVKYWISQGAQPSETVRSLIKKKGI